MEMQLCDAVAPAVALIESMLIESIRNADENFCRFLQKKYCISDNSMVSSLTVQIHTSVDFAGRADLVPAKDEAGGGMQQKKSKL